LGGSSGGKRFHQCVGYGSRIDESAATCGHGHVSVFAMPNAVPAMAEKYRAVFNE